MLITEYISDYYEENKKYKKKSNYIRRTHEKQEKIIKNKIHRDKNKKDSLIERKKSKNIIRKYSDIH